MTAASAFASAIAPFQSLASSGTALHHLASRWQHARAQRQQAARITRELQGYTDRQLADLGLSRADIPDVSRGMFRAG